MLLTAPMSGEALTAKVPITFWTVIIHIRCPTLVAAKGVFVIFLKRLSISRVRFRDDDHWDVDGAFFNRY